MQLKFVSLMYSLTFNTECLNHNYVFLNNHAIIILTKLHELTSVASIKSDTGNNNLCLVEPSFSISFSSQDFFSSSSEILCNALSSNAAADSFCKNPYVICMLKRTPPWQG